MLPQPSINCKTQVSVEYLDKRDGTFGVEINQFENL